MIELKTKLRKWGNSFGVVVPINSLQTENLKENEEVRVFITSERKVDLRKLFGKHKFRKSVKRLMRETDRELYNE